MKNAVLLIGNDINNITKGYSWGDLLNDLMAYLKLKRQRSMLNKPFPLFYEEIYLAAAKKNKVSEYEVKKFIANKVQQLEPGAIHKGILNLGCENILTTNYDSTFEKLIAEKTFANKGIIKESLYNLFRFYNIGDQKLWHIHGAAFTPRSVTLGYEHYSGYLHFIRNYVVTGTRETYKTREFRSLIKKIMKEDVTDRSWVDFFFTRDVYIFGLSLDFAEIHLWWLLTFRARLKYKDGLPVKNKIIYFYPEKFHEVSQHKLDMFQSTDVKTIAMPYEENNREAYYKSILDYIKTKG